MGIPFYQEVARKGNLGVSSHSCPDLRPGSPLPRRAILRTDPFSSSGDQAPSKRPKISDGASVARSGLGFMANRFDVVPVRANDETCIVVRVVLWTQTRCTIVFA